MAHNHLAWFLIAAGLINGGQLLSNPALSSCMRRGSNLSSHRRRGKDQFLSALNAAGLSGRLRDVENPLTGCTGEVLTVCACHPPPKSLQLTNALQMRRLGRRGEGTGPGRHSRSRERQDWSWVCPWWSDSAVLGLGTHGLPVED